MKRVANESVSQKKRKIMAAAIRKVFPGTTIANTPASARQNPRYARRRSRATRRSRNARKPKPTPCKGLAAYAKVDHKSNFPANITMLPHKGHLMVQNSTFPFHPTILRSKDVGKYKRWLSKYRNGDGNVSVIDSAGSQLPTNPFQQLINERDAKAAERLRASGFIS